MAFICRSQCKRFLLDMSKKYRNGKFTRVGEDVFEHLEFHLQREMIAFVRSHPTIGKTLKTGTTKRKKADDDI